MQANTIGSYLRTTILTGLISALAIWLMWKNLMPTQLDNLTWILYTISAGVVIWSHRQLQWHTTMFIAKSTYVFACIVPPLAQYLAPFTGGVSTHTSATIAASMAAYSIGYFSTATFILRQLPERRDVWDLSKRI